MKMGIEEMIAKMMDAVYAAPVELYSTEYEAIEKSIKQAVEALVGQGKL